MASILSRSQCVNAIKTQCSLLLNAPELRLWCTNPSTYPQINPTRQTSNRKQCVHTRDTHDFSLFTPVKTIIIVFSCLPYPHSVTSDRVIAVKLCRNCV